VVVSAHVLCLLPEPAGSSSRIPYVTIDTSVFPYYPKESTTMAVLARISGLLEPLRAFTRTKPVWGTCAGAILLSQVAEGMKKGGQDLLGGVDVKVARNGWGSQVS
jgi:glutamine amidotransferase PdxT